MWATTVLTQLYEAKVYSYHVLRLVSPWLLIHVTLVGAHLYSFSSTGNFNMVISEHMKQVLTMLSFETSSIGKSDRLG